MADVAGATIAEKDNGRLINSVKWIQELIK
jgi:hypothetical protein